MNLIFCGTPHFAVPTLERLIHERFSIQLVVTNPDEASGRGYERKAPPVKRVALRSGLLLFQPVRLKDNFTRDFLLSFHPDVIVVVAYGHILPSWMIDLPRLGCVNLHASLLPKYRGAAPIPWAIIRGERITGATTMRIDAGLDTGEMLLQRPMEIDDSDTTETVSQRLSAMGADLMVETLRGLERGRIKPRPQEHAQATLAPRLKKEDGWIDWLMGAEEIARRVRGLRPWPGAFTMFRRKVLRLWSAAPAALPAPEGSESGSLVSSGGKLFVACGGGALLELREVQLEGRNRMRASDFLNGLRLAPGEKLGAQ